jgi:hypothetical protein
MFCDGRRLDSRARSWPTLADSHDLERVWLASSTIGDAVGQNGFYEFSAQHVPRSVDGSAARKQRAAKPASGSTIGQFPRCSRST